MANKLKWFTHDHDAHDDPFIRDLMRRFGHFGYAAYFIILELLHRDGIGDVLVIRPERLCQKLCTRLDRARVLLDTCRDAGKMEVEWKPNEVCIKIKKFRERQSNMKTKIISKPDQPNIKTTLEGKGEGVEWSGKEKKEKSTPPSASVSSTDFVETDTETAHGATDGQTEKTTTAPRGVPSSFDAFWSLWPRKVGKIQAQKAWKKLNPDSALQFKILEAVKNQWDNYERMKALGKFVPEMMHPQGWLNNGRYSDHVSVVRRDIAREHSDAIIAADIAEQDAHERKVDAERAVKGAA